MPCIYALQISFHINATAITSDIHLCKHFTRMVFFTCRSTEYKKVRNIQEKSKKSDMSYGIPLAKQLFNLKVRYSYHGPAAQYFQLRSRISINEYRAGCSRTLTTAMVLYYVCFYINAYCKYCIFSTKIRFFLEQRTSEKQGVFYMLANLVNSRNKNEVSFSINTQVLSSMLIAIIHCCQDLEIQ